MSLRPTFLGFETMRKAISASQKALDITGNNIANVSSIGYSRQRLDVVSVANASNGLGYDTSVGLAGQGVNATGVTQIRDSFLDKRYRELNADSAEASTKSAVLTDIEDVLDVIDTDGFNQSYTNFKKALSTLATDSSSSSFANIALTSGKQAVQAIRSYNTKLTQVQDQTKFEIETGVSRVNQIIHQVADLNVQIANEYVANGDIFMEGNTYTVNAVYGPLELKDARNALLDELSNYGNIQISDNDNGSINVKFANTDVVEDKKYSKLVIDEHSTGTLSLHFENEAGNKTPVKLNGESLDSGALKGYLDMYNGAGVYADDVAIRQKGVDAIAEKINTLLTDISKLTTLADRESKQAELKEYDSSFEVNDTTGAVTFGASLVSVVTPLSAATQTVNKLDVSIDNASTAISYKFGTTAVGTVADPLGTGKMKTTLDDTKGDSTFSSVNGIVYYRKVIDALANTFATEFNAANCDSTMIDTVTGKPFPRDMFSSNDGGVIDSSNIKVSDEWLNDASLITKKISWTDATKTAVKSEIETTKELGNARVNKLNAVIKKDLKFTIDGANINSADATIDQTTTIDGYIKYWSINLGQEIEYQDSVYAAADTMATNVADARDAVMGVSIDEEGSNMLTFQKWFNASSRMMTTMDEALDTIINSMGLVGR